MIHWDNGPTKQITSQGHGSFSTIWKGDVFHCHLKGSELVWDDGDVWVRVQPSAEEGAIDDSEASKSLVTVRRIEDSATSSWWALPQRDGLGLVLGRGGARAARAVALGAAVLGAATVVGLAAVTCRAWRRRRVRGQYSAMFPAVIPFEALGEHFAEEGALLSD